MRRLYNPSTSLRSQITVLFALLLVTCLHRSALADPKPATAEDWVRYVPGDAHFFVEFHDLTNVRETFARLGMWDTIRELSQPSSAAKSEKGWHAQGSELLGLNRDSALSTLLGRRSLLIAADSTRWRDGLIMGRIADDIDLAALLKIWNAHPTQSSGDVHRYELSGGVLLATRGHDVLFGPADDPEGLWGRAVLLLEGRRGPSLAVRSDFTSLRERLSQRYPGLLYATWPDGDISAFAGCSRLIVGTQVGPKRLIAELHGLYAAPSRQSTTGNLDWVAKLPAASLAIFAGSTDMTKVSRNAIDKLHHEGNSLESLIVSVLTAFDKGRGDLLKNMGPTYALVLAGDMSTASQQGFIMPTLSLICESHSDALTLERLDEVVGFAAQVLCTIASKSVTVHPASPYETRNCEGVTIHYTRVGAVLAQREELNWIKSLEVAWSIFDGRLILSTSSSHVVDIISAAKGKTPTIALPQGPDALLPTGTATEKTADWIFVQSAATSGLMTTWLTAVEHFKPDAMNAAWWKNWASAGIDRKERLGLGLVSVNRGRPGALVREIADDSPANDLLREGDMIVSAAGSSLTTSQPAVELANRYRRRGPVHDWTLGIVREGKSQTIILPVRPASTVDLKEFDPIRALRQLITLMRGMKTITIKRVMIKPDRFDARLVATYD